MAACHPVADVGVIQQALDGPAEGVRVARWTRRRSRRRHHVDNATMRDAMTADAAHGFEQDDAKGSPDRRQEPSRLRRQAS